MICSSDTVEVVEHFLRVLQQGVSRAERRGFKQQCAMQPSEPPTSPFIAVQAQEAGGSEFKYGWVMMDKSKTEMAAVHQLVLSGDAKGKLLCYFHFLQEWERLLITSEAGVSREDKNRIMVALQQLMHCRNEQLFKQLVRCTVADAANAGLGITLHTTCPPCAARQLLH
jgi:hypothetical protein